MQNSEEMDFREGLMYDVAVKRSDTNFFKGDTTDLVFDTATNSLKIGDSGLPGGASSYSQYLLGDFEFTVQVDSLSPDSNDSEKKWGLINLGDFLERGAAYYEMAYDTINDTMNTRPFRAIIKDEYGNRKRTNITWDTLWNNAKVRYRITWENDACRFLINDSIYATLDGRSDTSGGAFTGINTFIPQALRIVNRTADDTAMKMSSITIRHSRKVI